MRVNPKNMAMKRELKKSRSKIAGEERKRGNKETENDELVITNIQTLTI